MSLKNVDILSESEGIVICLFKTSKSSIFFSLKLGKQNLYLQLRLNLAVHQNGNVKYDIIQISQVLNTSIQHKAFKKKKIGKKNTHKINSGV